MVAQWGLDGGGERIVADSAVGARPQSVGGVLLFARLLCLLAEQVLIQFPLVCRMLLRQVLCFPEP